MNNKIHFCRVVCDGNERTYLNEVLESGRLTSGNMTHKFEALFAEAIDARFSFAVNSCTAALHLGLEAIGVGHGDKVLVPTMTFAATTEIMEYIGADPICSVWWRKMFGRAVSTNSGKP
jgi:dTDP-4-amino-4,6-dideoxygalactose transaminase